MSLFSNAQVAYLKVLFQRNLFWTGSWTAGTYTEGQLVSHAGSTWLVVDYQTTVEPGTAGDKTWQVFGGGSGSSGATSLGELSDVSLTSPASGQMLRFDGSVWANNAKLRWDTSWDATYGVDGRLVLDYSGVVGSRLWTQPMPGVIFKQPGALAAGLFINFEDADGDRLDVGWGGSGGGNFELYSKNHTRKGQFRVTYGGGDFGHIQFSHFDGTSTFFASSGITKDGRFWCGLKETGMPGTADCTTVAWRDAAFLPAYPLQVYNENTTPALSFFVAATGMFCAKASLASAPTLSASRYAVWQDTAAPAIVRLTVSDASSVHKTYDLTASELPAVTGADDSKLLTVVDGAWAKAAAPTELPTPSVDGNVLTEVSGAWASVAPAAELPAPSVNGNVLTEVSGAWASAPIPQGVPAGAIMAFAMSTAPAGWLKCDGRSTGIYRPATDPIYTALFDAIGTTYGAGDGSTTFNLPDLRGEFIRGWADGGSVDTGRALGSAQDDMLKAHSHAITYANGASGTGTNAIAYPGTNWNTTSAPAGGTETRPRNVAMLYCIKF